MRDVDITITDGNIGNSSLKGEGVFLKIGASTVVTKTPIAITASMSDDTIYSLLGRSPLADSAIDSIDAGCSLIYCLPVANDSVNGITGNVTEGSLTVPKKTATGNGTLTVTGSPVNKFDIVVEIVGSGNLGVATFKYMINNGSWSNVVTVPATGKYDFANTGITGTFGGTEFVAGDVFKFSSTAPQMTNSGVLDALDLAPKLKQNFEMIHIVGGSDKALWASVAQKADSFYTVNKKPYPIVLEAKYKEDAVTVSDFVTTLVNDRTSISSIFVQICTAWSKYERRNGSVEIINNASIAMGMYAKAKVSQSIGEVKSFSVKESRMTELLPEGIEDYISILDNAGFLTFRHYDGLYGYYVTNARMASSEDSDYKYMERTRTLCKAYKNTRAAALKQLHIEIDVEDSASSLKAMAEFIAEPLEDMTPNEISGGRVEPADNDNILESETLYFNIFFTPKGIARELKATLGMENPYLTK